jgi:polar amino acid transport system substrate-binding protein
MVIAISRLGILVLATLIAGCGGSTPTLSPNAAATQAAPTASGASAATTDPSSPSAAPSIPPASALEAELVTAGRLTYCTNLRPGRMGFLDDSGQPAGVNIELAKEFARRLRLEAEIREMAFETLVDAVAGGQCDISISSQHITSTRLERIDMLAYTQGSQHIIVRAGNPAGIRGQTDLCGRILAVQTGSTHVDLVLGQGDHSGAGIDSECAAAGRPKVDLRQFEDDNDAIAALASGSADAYIGSDFITVDRATEFELSGALPPTRNGIGLPKDHPALRGAVEAAFDSMIGDGTYQAILDRFGVGDVSIRS